MKFRRRLTAARIACVLGTAVLLILPAPAGVWGFGKNKTQTRDLEWRVFETAHFEIHYYPEEEALAREVCRYAEEAYQHDTRLLRERPAEKTPLFLYRNQVDFQQTNILPSVIGVGTGGFTEAYKNRVALPAPDSPVSLRQVIFHEFTHVLQFNILYGEGMRSFRVYKGYLIPLWVIEGLAEYAAQDWNAEAEMVMRDAVLNDRLQPLPLLEGFSHLEDVYLAYKQAQLTMEYIAERYGEEKLASLFKRFKSQISLSQILRETLGLGLQELNEEFFYWVRQRYWRRTANLQWPSAYGNPMEPAQPGRPHVSVGAAYSPDGRYLAYVSNKDQNWRIYLKTRNQGYPARPITSQLFETFGLRGRPLTWSPDSRRLAFAAQTEGKTQLYFLDVASRRLEAHDLPADYFFSPAWSPQGDRLAVIGVRNGVSDVYVWNPSSGEFTPVTRDREANNSPVWSPDGTQLVFTSEQGEHWQILQVAAGQPEAEPQPLTRGSCNHMTPVFSTDGKQLYFASDLSGEFNLYRMDMATRAWTQLTSVPTAALQPAPAPEGQKLAFALYAKGSEDIWLMPDNPPSAHEVNPDQAKPTVVAAAPPAPLYEPEPTEEEEPEESEPQPAETPAPDSAPLIQDSHAYHFRFSPDLLFLLAGYDSSQGLIGGGYLTASDYLGNHNVSLISDFVPGYQTRTQLTYANLTYPVDILLSASYRKNYYRLLDLETNTLTDEFNDEEIGGALGLQRPFSLYDRVEMQFVVRNLRRVQDESVLDRRVTSLSLSLVHDSTVWYDFDPTNGSRRSLSVVWADRLLGGMENYSLLQANAQVFKSLDFLSPYLVGSVRLLAAASLGPEHPVFLFGGIGLLPESVTIRGYRYGELLGSQIGTLNFELRFPLARNINYTLWPLDFLLLKTFQMVIFDDLGVVTNDIARYTSSDLRNSAGVGLRLHTFLLGKELLTIRFDYSQRTDRPGDAVYVWGIGQSF
ncbi:MAG: BamA/TamA family outer membrane protein [candidate division FCPU426 bacterium]